MEKNFEFLIPILTCFGLFLMVFGIVYLKNREKMAMIERGMDPRAFKAAPQPYQNLKWGLLMVGSGLGLFIAYFIDMALPNDFDSEPAAIYFGLIAILGGLGLIISYRIEKKEVLDKPQLQI